MTSFDNPPTPTRRKPMRQWLGIEFSAYILLCAALITVAWTRGNVSGLVAVATWVVATLALWVTARGSYRSPGPRR